MMPNAIALLTFLIDTLQQLWLVCLLWAVLYAVGKPHLVWYIAPPIVAFRAWLNQYRRAETKEEAPPKSPERVFVEPPLEQLLGLGHYAIMPFYGKWVRISGRAVGAAESLASDSLHLTVRLDSGPTVNLQFVAKSREHLERLREGQRITAECQMGCGGPGIILLENCRLKDLPAIVMSTRPPIPIASRRAG